MRTIKTIAAVLTLTGAAAISHAELVNISASGTHSGTERALACTVVDSGTTLINGAVLIVFLAEGAGSGDPDIRVWSLDRSYSTSNNNWRDGLDITVNGTTQHLDLAQIYAPDPLYYPTILRAPNRTNDAAVFVAASRGERFCAESFDKSGVGLPRVSISATDMNAVLYKSMPVKGGNIGILDDSPVANALRLLQ